MKDSELNNSPHRRKNILTGEWILVSPHRTQRPWLGEVSKHKDEKRPIYDPGCYLCPGNKRANGDVNPDYKNTFVFTNDFSALIKTGKSEIKNVDGLLIAKTEKGICRVVNFSPRHDLTLAELTVDEIVGIIKTWQNEYETIGADKNIKYIQIFENKGSMMGNSNPHPHCQIWAQESIPVQPAKEQEQLRKYFIKNNKSLLEDYWRLEKKQKERIVFENKTFIVLVPFWATWPFETIIISKRKIANILQLKKQEVIDFAEAIKIVTVKYDNLFTVPFPYSSGIHQAPTDGKPHDEWHLHMHFYPPLLRSAEIKKHMVGYEMMAEPQRDITPERSAEILRGLSIKHY